MREPQLSRRLIAVVLVAAAVMHVSSLLLVGLALLPAGDSGRSLLLWPLGLVAFLLSLAGIIWGTIAVARPSSQQPSRHQQQPRTQQQPYAQQQAPMQQPQQQASPETEKRDTTVINPRRQSAGSPQTPSEPERQPRVGGEWARATTPWPRADEDDPDGTLIRPPHR